MSYLDQIDVNQERVDRGKFRDHYSNNVNGFYFIFYFKILRRIFSFFFLVYLGRKKSCQ